VKEPLRLPFVFLLLFLCTTAVLAALQVFAGGAPLTLELAALRLPRAAFDVMLPAVLLSIVLLGFRMVRRPFSRFLAFLIVLGASYAVLVNGLIWTHRAESSVTPAVTTPAASQYFSSKSFAAMGTRRIAPLAVKGNRLEKVLVFDAAAKAPRFTLYRAAAVSVQGGTVGVQLEGAKPLALRADLEPAAASLFAADPFTERFLRDFRTLNDDLHALLEKAPARFFFACFSILFLVTALLVLLRATRWPLLNVLLLVLAVRGSLLLYHVLATSLAPTVARIVSDPLLVRLAPSAAFILLGVLALLADVLFVPADRWTAEAAR
jgi:hypothetical protein